MKDELVIALVERFGAGLIGELDFNDGTARLILRKESAFRNVPGCCEMPPQPKIDRMTGKQDEPEDMLWPDGPAGQTMKGETITSPIVATFYASANPDTPPFVSAGTRVKAGETLCILEAMKMMNHLEAEFDCEILSIHATSGDLVEFGQPLFEVKRL